VCTVLLRFSPGAPWPLLVGAVRDEFVDRKWDPPGRHWKGRIIGGRDRVAGGTWLAVDPDGPAVAALLNGVELPVPADGVRPSRGALPLAVLTGPGPPEEEGLSGYDGFHLLRGTAEKAEVWSWDGVEFVHRRLDPGDHILVNSGIDVADDPLVPHFAPLLDKAASPDPRPGLSTMDAWGDWVELMAGGGLDPSDPRALIVRVAVGDRTYVSSSVTLVGIAENSLRYDFTATPGPAASWCEIQAGRSGRG
jgi:hypothetical protein